MVRRCAWCDLDMGLKEPFDDPSVSHGICLDCHIRVCREAGVIAESNPVPENSENSLEFSREV